MIRQLKRIIGVGKSQRLLNDEEREKLLVHIQADAWVAMGRLRKEYPGAELLWKEAVEGFSKIANPGQARTSKEADENSGYETLLTFATTKEGDGDQKEAQRMLDKWERLAGDLERYAGQMVAILKKMDEEKNTFFAYGLQLDKLLEEWNQVANDNTISKRARGMIDKRVEEYAKFVEVSNSPEQVQSWEDQLRMMKEFDERLAETVEMIRWDIETAGPAVQGQTEGVIIGQMEEAIANAFPNRSRPAQGDAHLYMIEAQGRLERAKRNEGSEYNILDLFAEMKAIEDYIQKAREAS